MFAIEIFYNLSMLVALSIFSGFIDNKWNSKSSIGASIQGVLFGLVAIMGMLNPLVFDPGIVFDGRSVVISLCAFFFGPIAAAISGSMAIVLRIFQGGAGTIMGVSVVTASALIGVLFHYKFKLKEKRVSSLFLLGFGILVHIAMLLLAFTLPLESALAVHRNVGIPIIVFYPIFTILIGKVLYDQEVRRESVRALQKSEQLFRSLSQSSPIGIYKISGTGEITFANSRWCEILGVKGDGYIGFNHLNFVSSVDLDRVVEIWSSYIKQPKNFSIEFRVDIDERNNIWLLGQYEPEFDEYGSFKGFVGSITNIDERKKVEEQLKLWEDIFKSTRMGIVVGKEEEEHFSAFNPAFAQLYGYTQDEMNAMPIASVFAENERHKIPEAIRKAYELGFYVFQSWHVKKDGTRFPVLMSITGVKDAEGKPLYRIVNVQDITDRVESEFRLKHERARLAGIIEGTNVGTWEWNVQTGQTVYNERWAQMIGYSLDEIGAGATVDTWLNFVHPDDAPKAMGLIHKHFDGETEIYECEFRMKHKDGHWVWVLDRGKVAQRTEEGKPFLMFGFHLDITERKRWQHKLQQSEQKLKEQNEEYFALNEELTEINSKLKESEQRLKEQNEEYLALNEELTESNQRIISINSELAVARQKAEESDTLKSAFLANMSHEIRTPMNAIVGFSEILLRPNLSKEKQTLYTEVLNASCNQLLGVINDVLDISKIETGQVVVHTSELNINKMLRGVKAMFTHNAHNKKNKITLSLDLSDDTCLMVTDESKVTQVVTNLVSNAIKFTDGGQIDIGYKVTDNQIEFWVSDTGIGIALENQHLVFERFRQVEVTTQRNYGGTGLGLSICKAYVEMLGGTIGLNSNVEEGTRFFFKLPFKPELPGEKGVKSDTVEYNFSGKIILVAEDEPVNYLYLKELLADTEAYLIHVENGADAIKQLEQSSGIDLVLMDVKMPVINGIEATKAIRSKGITIPIIALTAYAMSGDKERCISAGCNGYVSKPIIRDDLLTTIKSLI